MRRVVHLTPEQQQAERVFQTYRSHQEQLLVNGITEDHLKTGSKIFVKGRIGRTSLPHEKHWVWNQSKAQKVIEETEEYEIILKKLNPRKKIRTQQQSFPPFKLWVVVIRNKDAERENDMNFIWCEKGNPDPENPEQERELPPIPIVPISSIHDLSFLITFMEPHVAMSIFSPSSY